MLVLFDCLNLINLFFFIALLARTLRLRIWGICAVCFPLALLTVSSQEWMIPVLEQFNDNALDIEWLNLKLYACYFTIIYFLGALIANVLRDKWSYAVGMNINLIPLSTLIKILLAAHMITTAISMMIASPDIYSAMNAPRRWELSFGRSVVRNYVFFLAPIISCLVIYRTFNERRPFRWSEFLVVGYCSCSSALLGNKFAVMDAAAIPAFFFLYLHGRLSLAVIFAGILTLAFFVAFGVYFRGDSDIIYTYVISSYANLPYFNPFPPAFNAFNAVTPEKLSFSIFSDLHGDYTGGFLLNDKYNMSTAFPVIGGFLFPVGALLMLTVLFSVMINRLPKGFFAPYLASAVMYGFFMMFFYNHFTKDKNIYLLIVAYTLCSISPALRHGRLAAGSIRPSPKTKRKLNVVEKV